MQNQNSSNAMLISEPWPYRSSLESTELTFCWSLRPLDPKVRASRQAEAGADVETVLSQGNHISSKLILGHFPCLTTRVISITQSDTVPSQTL